MMGRRRDGSSHDAVLSNILDLQSRLRGDPASLFQPREGRPPITDAFELVAVSHGELEVSDGSPRPRPEPIVEAVEGTEQRISELQRRLQLLELDIETYEESHRDPQRQGVATSVVDLQKTIDRRLRRS
jgi:hypothetical protein